MAGMWAIVVITSAGLFRLGSWLRAEEPADLGHPDQAVTA